VVVSEVASVHGGTYGNSTVGQWTSLRGVRPPFRFGEWTCFTFGQIESVSPYWLDNFEIIATKNGVDWYLVCQTYSAGSPGPENLGSFYGWHPSAVGDAL